MKNIVINTPTKLSQLDTILTNMANEINEMQGEIDALKSELLCCEKKRPNPKNVNPYDASRFGGKRR
jgi:hypothetical protein